MPTSKDFSTGCRVKLTLHGTRGAVTYKGVVEAIRIMEGETCAFVRVSPMWAAWYGVNQLDHDKETSK